MSIEMCCPSCRDVITLGFEPLGREPGEVETGLCQAWEAMGDGQTVEDWLSATLVPDGVVQCQRCGERVEVGESQLNAMALTVLAGW